MVTWLNTTFASFDYSILSYLHELAMQYGDILTPIARFFSLIGDLPLLVLGWFSFALFFIMKNKRLSIWMCGSIIMGALLTTVILKTLIYRPRPYLSDIEVYKTWWETFNLKVDWDTSFPSGHACAAMSGVSAFFLWSKKKGLAVFAFIYPLIMGACRLYLCVHYPSDVIAGYIVGFSAAILVIPFVNLFYYLFHKYPNCPFSKYCLTGRIK